MGWGAGKGKVTPATVQKPYLKAGTTGTTWTKPQTIPARQSGAVPGYRPARPAGPAGPVATGWASQGSWSGKGQSSPKGNSKGPSKGFAGKGSVFGGYSAKGGVFNAKGKIKGKGKGKPKGAPPANSEYWQIKMASENREVLGGTYTGTIASYNIKFGWGFISPDNTEELPEQAQMKILEANSHAEAEGKSGMNLLYFRKPDITQGVEVEKEKLCTFSVYVDDKGAGACEVTC